MEAENDNCCILAYFGLEVKKKTAIVFVLALVVIIVCFKFRKK